MKAQYIKPIIAVDTLSLDMPLASNCTATRQDMEDLLFLGYFNQDRVCDDIVDDDDDIYDYRDTVCYYSNVTVALLS